jgi:hypothetical protein
MDPSYSHRPQIEVQACVRLSGQACCLDQASMADSCAPIGVSSSLCSGIATSGMLPLIQALLRRY